MDAEHSHALQRVALEVAKTAVNVAVIAGSLHHEPLDADARQRLRDYGSQLESFGAAIQMTVDS